MKRWKVISVVFGLTLLLFGAVSSPLQGPRQLEAAFPGAANLQVVAQSCLPNNAVRIQLVWTTYGQGPQWVDLSLSNNGFAPATFIGLGPVSASVSSFTWDGLLPGLQHYLRVNTITGQGWWASETISFVTRNDCAGLSFGARNLGAGAQTCQSGGLVDVQLAWTSSGQGEQWADMSKFNNNFAPGTFVGLGPYSAATASLLWLGLEPGVQYYLRVNTFTSIGWVTSATVSFVTRADCRVVDTDGDGISDSVDACPSQPGPASTNGCPVVPPPPIVTCPATATPSVVGGFSGCVFTDKTTYHVGEPVTYCYGVNKPMYVQIIVTRPDGPVTLVDGMDDGRGACLAPLQAGLPLGTRTVRMYGGASATSLQLLDEESFTVGP